MSLYWPASAANVVLNAPRLHALVIGVGEYEHLGPGVLKPSNFLSGLQPLTTTVPAARRIVQWLEREYQNPACPLGSIEVVLSPKETMTRADGSNVNSGAATMAETKQAFDDWYARCNQDEGSIAFFYFAGHGISTISQFLLLSDFGNPDLPDEWENCIDFSGMKSGMIKCKADTQLYFIDACRDAPIAALTKKNPHGRPLAGGSTFLDTVDLSIAYYAASEGRAAHGKDGEETYFCKALITCLNGAGARKPLPWRVNTAALSYALGSVIEEMASVTNLPLTCECPVLKPVTFHYPPKGAVVVSVSCDDDQASAESAIRITQGAKVRNSVAGESRPWMDTVDPGPAQIDLTFSTFPPKSIQDELTPPTYPVEYP